MSPIWYDSAMAQQETIRAKQYVYTCVFDPETEGGFTVTCPALPGLVTYGETLDEARRMAAEAIEGYLEALHRDGLAIPLSEEHNDEPIREGIGVTLKPA